MKDQIHNVLIELHLNNSLSSYSTYTLKEFNNQLSLENELEKIPLPVQVNKNQAYLNEVKSEIESIIGLKNVKEFVYQLENHLVLQQFRESQGHQATRLSMHMVFAGNPGTGNNSRKVNC